jgi:hypothetical protein
VAVIDGSMSEFFKSIGMILAIFLAIYLFCYVVGTIVKHL